MGFLQSILASYPSASAPPSPPDLTGIAALYSSFGIAVGWQNGNPLVGGSNTGSVGSTAITPYPLSWADFGGVDDNLSLWNDQSGGNFDASSGALPVIDPIAQRFTYDGTQNLATPTGIISGDKLTIYCVFSTNNLAAAQTLLQGSYTADYITRAQNIFAIYLTAAGVITVSQKTDDLVDVFNTQIKTLSNTGLHLLTVVFDRSISGAGATAAKLDNLTTGWTSAVSGNMTGTFLDVAIGIGLGQPTGVNSFLNGTFEHLAIFNAAHNDSQMTEWWNYFSYIYPDLP